MSLVGEFEDEQGAPVLSDVIRPLDRLGGGGMIRAVP
jgi:hypothetical protein